MEKEILNIHFLCHRGRDLLGPRQLAGFSAFLGMLQVIFVLCIGLVFN